MCNQCHHIDPTLGLVATGRRNIRSGREYDHLFNLDVFNGKNQLLKKGDTFETLKQMEKIVKSTLSHTANIAQKLSSSTSLQATTNNIWEFVYRHIQYKLDDKGTEQLRYPIRTWHDRRTGVDCDCYSIFISSILTNLGIPHAFRMTKYSKGWQHVYVVVPINGKRSGTKTKGGYITIDAVIDQFNYEKPFTKKFDRFMEMPIHVLSGLDAAVCCGQHPSLSSRPKGTHLRKPSYRRANTQERRAIKFAKKHRFNKAELPPRDIVTRRLPEKAKLTKVTSPVVQAQVKAAIISDPKEVQIVDVAKDQVQAGMGKGAKIAIVALIAGTLLMYGTRPQNKIKDKGLSGVKKAKKAVRKTTKKPAKKAKTLALS